MTKRKESRTGSIAARKRRVKRKAKIHPAPGVISQFEIYTIEELFNRVGISESGIREAKKRGLKVKRFGRKKVIRGLDIFEYLELQEDI